MSELNVKELIDTMVAIGMETHVIDEDMGPTSPFIAGTNVQFAWDATSLDYLKRCPRLYQYIMIEGYRSKEENIDIRFGAEYHFAMQDYEKAIATGIPHDDAVFDVVRELLFRIDDWRPDHKYKNRVNLIRAVVWHLDKSKDDKAKTVILENGKPAVELNFSFELDYGPTDDQPYVLCGYLDRIVEFNGEEFVLDYKTTKTTPGDYYWAQFEPNNQMTLYNMAARVIRQAKVTGVIIDAAQLMVDTVRFARGVTYRTEDQLNEWVIDLRYWLERAYEFAKQDYWPMNDTACDKYGGCKFREICNKSPGVRQRFLQSNFDKVEPWNPLKPR